MGCCDIVPAPCVAIFVFDFYLIASPKISYIERLKLFTQPLVQLSFLTQMGLLKRSLFVYSKKQIKIIGVI